MNNSELHSHLLRLRDLTIRYRLTEKENISSGLGIVEIAVNLVEMYLLENRKILKQEKIWFNACYNLVYTFSSDSEWEEIPNLYCELVDEMEARNFK
jgi:hypothetical protein